MRRFITNDRPAAETDTVFKINDPQKAAPLFADWEETLIWSCLQGVMGTIYADRPEGPLSAMAVLGDFVFLAGTPNKALAAYPHKKDYLIIVPQNEEWQTLVAEVYGSRAKLVSRYATEKKPDSFDPDNLKRFAAALPPGYQLRMIDRELYDMCRSQAWSADLVSQVPAYESYRTLGLGAAIVKNGQIVSGASSYAAYRGGIEIEIDTKKEYRRKGLALVCAAALILECLKRGIYPSWDAHNQASLALAEKLGYRYSHTYTAIEIGEFPDALTSSDLCL